MINQQELAALVELAGRAHKSQAESLWLNELVARLNEQAQVEQMKKQKAE